MTVLVFHQFMHRSTDCEVAIAIVSFYVRVMATTWKMKMGAADISRGFFMISGKLSHVGSVPPDP